MSITQIGSTTTYSNETAASSATKSYTQVSGTNTILVVGWGSEGAGVHNTVTFDGNSLTLLESYTNNNEKVSMWYLVNPPVTTANVVATFSSGTGEVGLTITSWKNVDQTTPFSNSVEDGSTGNPSVTCNSDSGELVIDCFTHNDFNVTAVVGSGQTEISNITITSDFTNGMSIEDGASPNVTMSWSGLTNYDWAHVAGSMKYVAPPWYNSNWLYRMPVTVDSSKVTSGPHTSFPVVLEKTADAGFASKAGANLEDVLFTLDDGTTKLDHEWQVNKSNGEFIAWIRIPSLPSTVDTTIYMYYGGPATTSNIDNTSNSTGTNQDTDFSWSHTISTVDNTILVVGVSWRNSGPGTETVTGVTYNSVACTFIRKDEYFNSQSRSTAFYYIVNPSSGTNIVEVTFSGTVWRAVGGAVSITGIDQTNPIDVHSGTAGGSGTSVSTNITTTVDNTWIVDVICNREGTSTATAGGGQTERWDYLTGSGEIVGSGSTKQLATAGSTSMSWTVDSGIWSQSVVALKIATQADPEAVWDSGFEAVYHMSQSPDGTVLDSTSNNKDLTVNVGMDSGDLVAGVIGKCIAFDNSPNYLKTADSTTITLPGDFTFEAWVQPDAMNGWRTVLHLDDGAGTNYRLWTIQDSNPEFDYYDDGTEYQYAPTQTGTAWRHLATTYNDALPADRMRGFKDGAKTAEKPSVPNLASSTGPLIIGSYRWDNDSQFYDFWDGKLDEIRISNVIRSDGWIATTHKNAEDIGAFWGSGFGTEETEGGGGGYANKVNTIISFGKINGISISNISLVNTV